MKVKCRLFNLPAFFRALLVGVLALGGTVLLASLVKEILDLAYRQSGEAYWSTLFYSLSSFEVPIAALILLVSVALCGGWIMTPVFNDFSNMVSESLQIEGEPREVLLPKRLERLEGRLNAINKELRLWRYAVREAEQRKDELVVYLAHDIRTPLTSVLGYLELITENPELPEESRVKYAEIALRKAERMQLLVEELFEITRFNVSQIELGKQEVKASVFFNQLIEEVAPLFAERNIEISFENSGVETLFIDGAKFARAVDNILNNAAHYTPEGEKVGIRLDELSDGRTRIRIFNTGNEISQDKLDRFFERFYRGDEARKTESGGAGLGLAIAKNLIEAHGGSLTAANKNRVTVFSIIL